LKKSPDQEENQTEYAAAIEDLKEILKILDKDN